MAEHTPGPWEKRPPGEFQDEYYGFDYRVGPAVLFVSSPPSPEDIANVNLIHAAPDLLEAAKAIDALLENLFESVPWGETFGVDMKALNEAPIALKAAIAKAAE